MDKVLLVEDSKECQFVVSQALANTNIDLTVASSVKEALHALQTSQSVFDLIILDIVLPDGEGFTVLDKVRSMNRSKEPPIFFLTSTSELSSKVTAFNLGADDYLVKPISPIELKVRVETKLKKSRSPNKYTEQINKRDLILNVSHMTASVHEGLKIKNLGLTIKEFKILFFLAQNEGQVYSRSDLVQNIWGESIHVLARTVDAHICSLRKKLSTISNYIECIPGSGYRFVPAKEELTEPAPRPLD